MSDTPRTDALYAKLPSTCDTAGDAEMVRQMGDLARALERELAAATARVAELDGTNVAANAAMAELVKQSKEATARAESAERDALQRAADVCEVKGMEWQRQYINAKENDHLLNGLSGGALDCRDAILALIPKERT